MIIKRREMIMKDILFMETSTGIDVHGQDVNEAASRAGRDGIHYKSILEQRKMIHDGELSNMKVNVKLAIPQDLDRLEHDQIKNLIPYGEVTVEVTEGGMATTSGIFLEDQHDQNDLMYIVNAVVEVGY